MKNKTYIAKKNNNIQIHIYTDQNKSGLGKAIVCEMAQMASPF